ncbi:MAG: bifunctional folylpolyglutamate synthase/dihydrofolate synthase, partial [Clostridiales bacterium]|nr:bifunctional folylpolyglutamate synthase/dihydrofolate synthase [Clostridiales bacterium]
MTAAFETAAQAIGWINGLRYAGEKHGLDNMRRLLSDLGDPQKGLKMAHVAGTNGKGSTCAMLERMLRENGLKTGLYTSPYLMRFNERMRVNGAPIDDATLVRLASRVREAAEALVARGVRPTTFELGTALAFLYFREAAVDAAVIEVGLGGRLDPTNVIEPAACLIAPIGMDHTRLLGDTPEQIALEKAGIIKPGVPVAIACQPDGVRAVLRAAAQERGAPLTDLCEHEARNLRETARGAAFELDGLPVEINLAGRHQVGNAGLAIAGVRLLKEAGLPIDIDRALFGIRRAVWPGRLEWAGEDVLLDGAHNPHGAAALVVYLQTWLAGREVVPVVGMMRDKAIDQCAALYAQVARRAVATQIDYPRAASAAQIAEALRRHGVAAE